MEDDTKKTIAAFVMLTVMAIGWCSVMMVGIIYDSSNRRQPPPATQPTQEGTEDADD